MAQININNILTYMINHGATLDEALKQFDLGHVELNEETRREFDRQMQLHNTVTTEEERQKEQAQQDELNRMRTEQVFETVEIPNANNGNS